MINNIEEKTWCLNEAKLGKTMEEISEFISEGNIENNYFAMLVFEEEFVNICNHAYINKKGPICIKVIRNKDNIEMVFIDNGIPFDLTKIILDKDMERIGGHGLEIIKQYSKEIEYKRIMEFNLLKLIVE